MKAGQCEPCGSSYCFECLDPDADPWGADTATSCCACGVAGVGNVVVGVEELVGFTATADTAGQNEGTCRGYSAGRESSGGEAENESNNGVAIE